MRYLSLSLITVFFALLTTQQGWTEPPQAKSKPTSPSKGSAPQLSDGLKAMNRIMHQALGEVVQKETSRFGPMIIAEAQALKLYRNEKLVATYPIPSPLIYHQLKVYGHMALGAVIMLQRTDWPSQERLSWLAQFEEAVGGLKRELPTLNFDQETAKTQEALVELTLALIKQARATPQLDQRVLREYSKQSLPMLKRGFEVSARAQIDVIHAQGMALYAQLTEEERKTVRAYTYGGRGARVGNLTLQYLSWLIGEHRGVESERMIFSEGVTNPKAARIALAKYLTELRLADIFFSDPHALHRDVLIEATRDYLSTFPKVEDAFKASRAK